MSNYQYSDSPPTKMQIDSIMVLIAFVAVCLSIGSYFQTRSSIHIADQAVGVSVKSLDLLERQYEQSLVHNEPRAHLFLANQPISGTGSKEVLVLFIQNNGFVPLTQGYVYKKGASKNQNRSNIFINGKLSKNGPIGNIVPGGNTHLQLEVTEIHTILDRLSAGSGILVYFDCLHTSRENAIKRYAIEFFQIERLPGQVVFEKSQHPTNKDVYLNFRTVAVSTVSQDKQWGDS